MMKFDVIFDPLSSRVVVLCVSKWRYIATRGGHQLCGGARIIESKLSTITMRTTNEKTKSQSPLLYLIQAIT